MMKNYHNSSLSLLRSNQHKRILKIRRWYAITAVQAAAFSVFCIAEIETAMQCVICFTETETALQFLFYQMEFLINFLSIYKIEQKWRHYNPLRSLGPRKEEKCIDIAQNFVSGMKLS